MEQDCATKAESSLISALFHPGSRHIDVCSYFGFNTEKHYISELFFSGCFLHQED